MHSNTHTQRHTRMYKHIYTNAHTHTHKILLINTLISLPFSLRFSLLLGGQWEACLDMTTWMDREIPPTPKSIVTYQTVIHHFRDFLYRVFFFYFFFCFHFVLFYFLKRFVLFDVYDFCFFLIKSGASSIR